MKRRLAATIGGAMAAAILAGCGAKPNSLVQGKVSVDGSTALYPFNLKIEKTFNNLTNDDDSSVEHSGDRVALRRFCEGEIDIAAVSRPINSRESALCGASGITYHRILIARQAAVVVANKALGIDCLTTSQLNRLWRRGSNVSNYRQLGGDLPSAAVSLYGPTSGSAVYSLFTSAINGSAGNSRSDYKRFVFPNGAGFASAVAGDSSALGYFDFTWLRASLGEVETVAVDNGSGCVLPSDATVQNGSYAPLSSPFYYYFKLQPIEASSAVYSLVQIALANAKTFAKNHYVVPITPAEITAARVEWLRALRTQRRLAQQ